MKNKLKIIISCALSFSVLVSVLFFVPKVFAEVATPTLTIGSVAGKNGDTLSIPITATNFNNNAVAGIDFKVGYDSSLLTLTSVTQNAISGHGLATISSVGTNPIVLNWFDSNPLAIDSGTIVTLNFTVIGNTTTTTNLTFSNTSLANGSGDPIIPTNFINGSVELTLVSSGSASGGGGGGGGGNYTATNTSPTQTYMIGDINKDGKVDKYDFAILMANWGATGANIADLNNDNKVDKYDFALLMLNWGK